MNTSSERVLCSQAEAYQYPSAGNRGELRGAWPPMTQTSSENVEQRERQAYERGRKEAAAEADTRVEQGLSLERHAIVAALEQFQQERQAYYQQVETEVVQLALAVARKILHRESQMDPMLLTGVVRVALEKLQEGTRVRMRVPASQAAMWRQQFSQDTQLKVAPEIIEDTALETGNCRLETSLGASDLSLEQQLKEIEQGFLDLLAKKPQD